MNKEFKLILKIVSIITIIFFVIDYINLENYSIYEGKIIGLDNQTSKFSNHRSSVRMNWNVPILEYYKNPDTIKSADGRLVLHSSFELNEKIRVLESKKDRFDVKIYSFFYYWLNFPELVIIGLLSIMVYGYYYVFMRNQ